MDHRSLKQIDILRHELKALRYILDNYHAGRIEPLAIPPCEDFQSEQGRRIWQVILEARSRAEAEERLRELEFEGVDVESFLRLSGEQYYTYPALVRERAAGIRAGRLKVEPA